MTKDQLYVELLETHWLECYSWRGLEIASLEKRYVQDKATILSVMREIAHTHRNPDLPEVIGEKACRSCGMPMVFMAVQGESKPHPCDIRQRKILTKRGVFELGRESHFASCPDAEWWRKKN